MEEKKPKWEEENWETEQPEKCDCKNCIHRAKDRCNRAIKGFTLDLCEVFPDGKPEGVLFDGAECPYHCEDKE